MNPQSVTDAIYRRPSSRAIALVFLARARGTSRCPGVSLDFLADFQRRRRREGDERRRRPLSIEKVSRARPGDDGGRRGNPSRARRLNAQSECATRVRERKGPPPLAERDKRADRTSACDTRGQIESFLASLDCTRLRETAEVESLLRTRARSIKTPSSPTMDISRCREC